MEKEQQKIKNFSLQILKDLNCAVIAADCNGTVNFMNPAAEKLTGWQFNESNNKDVSEILILIKDSDNTLIKNFFGRLINNIEPLIFENDISLINKNGEKIPVILNISPIADEMQNINGEVFTIHDVKERKNLEDKLQASNSELKTIFSSINDAIFVLNDEGVYLKVSLTNPANLFKPADELEGKTLHEIFPKEKADKFLHLIKESLDKKITVNTEYDLIINNEKKWFSASLSPMINNRVVWVARDITANKSDDEEKEELFKKVSEAQDRLKILSRRLIEVQELERRHISRELHDEIGQSLTAAKICIQTLHNSAESVKLKKSIMESIELIENALNQVRNLSLDLRPSILDDLGLLPAIRWYLNRQAWRAGIKTKLFSDKKDVKLLPEIEITCFRVLQEALTNIIRHAEARNVKVNLDIREESLYLKITDDGNGFDVNSARMKAIAGKSIGILGMQERVELLGGFFEIYSTLEKGTEILAVFPLNLKRKSFG